MTKNKTIKTIAGATLGVVGLGATFALADTGNNNTNTQTNSTFSGKMGFQNLTDAQKTALAQARTLMQQGKQTEAKAILDAAEVKAPEGKNKKGEYKMNKGSHENMKKIDDAILAGDYAAFKTAAANTPLANITQDVFNSLKAPTQAKQAAETAEKAARDQIQTILKNAGVQIQQRGNKDNVTTTTNQ